MLPLVTPSFLNPVRIPTSEAPGIALKNACTPREKSRLSMTFSTVGSSGKPSKNLSVPSRVSTESGVVISGGMSVVIFIFGGGVGEAVLVQPARDAAINKAAKVFVIFTALLLFSDLGA